MDEVSLRELRNAIDDVFARVERGASLTVARDGEPVAELHPASHGRLSREALLSRWRAVPAVDPTAFRADVSHLLDGFR